MLLRLDRVRKASVVMELNEVRYLSACSICNVESHSRFIARLICTIFSRKPCVPRDTCHYLSRPFRTCVQLAPKIALPLVLLLIPKSLLLLQKPGKADSRPLQHAVSERRNDPPNSSKHLNNPIPHPNPQTHHPPNTQSPHPPPPQTIPPPK